ncbi:hypothetical protein TBLA_0H00630 [Henningerozyma blattae CBS 6284]|uniref:Uncharacterized protein n=1 Tax=Henningerozyma blattae (strain ATCC 34711 / CBS 6284 / DSM 70876 / NBRC 10599 / NRRL Y-10934 / UCD 77-7) TaxID=1071380 RepID=I2H7K2_HENB6|nr:hypothetical protein TBLA_0H00630 [Tetrapisispora blattae CBS 6284]CCH62354.1 hypothetical protein TBLA_0H00630 [Tetrapisispora blattae CBS 6284]
MPATPTRPTAITTKLQTPSKSGSITPRRTVNSSLNSAASSASNLQSMASNTPLNSFNSRLFWPDMITLPENKWCFDVDNIINRLKDSESQSLSIKKNMEKCLIYFYNMKKKLKLFDHTYTASCILFFRYWYVYNLPPNIIDCIHLSQAILVTACKTMENNRPAESYVNSTCEFIAKDIYNGSNVNIDKLKWETKDRLVNNEKKILCQFGFDLNLDNPKEIIEEIFNGFYRFNRDFTLTDDFKKIFPKIIQEARNFIIQAITQPISLLFDGYTFIVISLIYCGLQYKTLIDKDFKFPKNFFKDRFPIILHSIDFEKKFQDYKLIEETFFDLKSNKKDKLSIKKEDIESLLQEDDDLEEDSSEQNPKDDPYSYEKIKSGIVKQELLDHTQERLNQMLQNTINESKKRTRNEPFAENDLLANKDIKRTKI